VFAEKNGSDHIKQFAGVIGRDNKGFCRAGTGANADPQSRPGTAVRKIRSDRYGTGTHRHFICRHWHGTPL